jgi:hypothetical protein
MTTLVPAETLSDRERDMLFLACETVMVPMERLELLDFLGYPDPMPRLVGGRVLAVVNRILAARARGEHIS